MECGLERLYRRAEGRRVDLTLTRQSVKHCFAVEDDKPNLLDVDMWMTIELGAKVIRRNCPKVYINEVCLCARSVTSHRRSQRFGGAPHHSSIAA